MAVYIFMLIGAVVIGIPLCGEKYIRAGKIIYCLLTAIAFIIISSIRFNVGYDYNMYGSMYINMQYREIEDLLGEKMEKGFLLPLYVLGLGFENYVTLFIYTSIIIYSSVFFLIYKNSSCPWISVVAYLCFGLFFNSLCFLRQVIAATIVLYGMKFIDRKNPVKFFILVLAASAFHWSVLIMLLMFFLLKIRPGYIYLGIIAAGTTFFCIFSKKLMIWATNHFSMYSIYDLETNVEASNGLSIRYTVMFGILFALCFIFRKKLIKKNPSNSIYINCLMYAVVFETMGTRHAVLSRFTIVVYMAPFLYMLPDLVLVIKELIAEKFSERKALSMTVKISSAAALILYSAGCYVILMLNNYNGVVPYVSQFNIPYDISEEQIIYNEDDDSEDEDGPPDLLEDDDNESGDSSTDLVENDDNESKDDSTDLIEDDDNEGEDDFPGWFDDEEEDEDEKDYPDWFEDEGYWPENGEEIEI